jgi:hypothetical protein
MMFLSRRIFIVSRAITQTCPGALDARWLISHFECAQRKPPEVKCRSVPGEIFLSWCIGLHAIRRPDSINSGYSYMLVIHKSLMAAALEPCCGHPRCDAAPGVGAASNLAA